MSVMSHGYLSTKRRGAVAYLEPIRGTVTRHQPTRPSFAVPSRTGSPVTQSPVSPTFLHLTRHDKDDLGVDSDMRIRPMAAIAVLSALSLVAAATPSWAEPTSSTETTLIVALDSRPPDPATAARTAVAAAGGHVVQAHAISSDAASVTVKATAQQAEAVSSQTEARPGIASSQVSRRVQAASTDDTYYSRLWNLNNASGNTYGVNAEAAWPTSTGEHAVVGVIDTGITVHPDLNGNVVAGYDFISEPAIAGDGDGRDADPTDPGDWLPLTGSVTDPSSWHGTHVAGIIAATANNGLGVAGVSPKAQIEPLRVLGHGGGTEDDIIAAINWGAGLSVAGLPTNSQPADVLNLSLAGEGSCGTTLQDSIDSAVAAGTVVVVAAGNNGGRLSNYFPANCSNVIRVTASNATGGTPSWSNLGSTASPATVAAPGASIYSTYNTGVTTAANATYGYMSGTSMAAPHVAGVAALAKATDSSLTPAQVASLLTRTAKPLGGSCATAVCGAGIVDAQAAMADLTSHPFVGSTRISGVARVGQRLTAGYRAFPSSATVSYQWYRSGVAIAGATTQSYTQTSIDYTKLVSVTVRAAVGDLSASSSAAVRTSYGVFGLYTYPRISGTYKVGRTLSASLGRWSPTPSHYTFQWLRDGRAIKKATKASYKLTKADRRHKVSVKVTVKRSGYANRSFTTSRHSIR